MNNSHRTVRFPSVTFVSQEEFEAYRQSNRPVLDGRYLHETGLASSDPVVTRPGSCAACLRSTIYSSSTARGEPQPDGRLMPNWREEQYCDCEDHLPQRSRSLLHFVEATKSLHGWSRLMQFGRASAADARLAAMASSSTRIPRLHRHGFDDNAQPRYRIAADEAAFHTVVSVDYLQHVPPLMPALTEVRRVLVPGGRFIFMVPFRMLSAETETKTSGLPKDNGGLPVEINQYAHEFGWDIIDRLHEAGFEDAHLHMYWSDELGYLGSFKTIFMAIA